MRSYGGPHPNTKKPMKIWFPAIRGGSGVDVHTRRLAGALEQRGIGATISWFATYFQFLPFALGRVSPPPEVTIVHSLSWFGFAFKRPGVPLVVTEQLDVLDPRYRPYKSAVQTLFHEWMVRGFVKRSFAAASAVTAVSQATAASLTQTVDFRSASVIPNFVNTSMFQPKNGTSWSHHTFKLLFVGNLTRRKGADLLAPIMRRLGNRFELRFTTGLREGKLNGIPPNMISVGKLTTDQELIGAYQDCDALLFPSRLEGLPIAALEAMACGKPIVAARVSSLPEVVDDEVTGILCEPDNVLQFVSACRRLADSPGTVKQLGEAARQRAESLFSESAVIPQYIALYEKLASTKTS